jgi:hypothetical protein
MVYYIDLSFAQEVFEKFQMYKVMVEIKLGMKLKTLWFDNG